MRTAEVHYGSDGQVNLTVPKGTKMADIAKLQEMVIAKINPRGCQACLSGVHFNIREELEHVMKVDLDKMAAIKGTTIGH
ncbi:hypothetical protein HHL17_02145 [Chitinophaga sp. G-6-1-13]|uniref:Uncharacterized protein n=1 Tax=Chitinophaga fulva TaxID=2728842 RepID=A0A848GDY7_9BACT|nr:hypothetical protein [Chitinophaga fulva]NML35987.1 hypothetical protein [Chitinophaga fulva]